MFLVGVWLHGCLHVQMTGEVQVTLEIQGIKKKGRTAVATSMHHHHPGHKMQNAEIYLHKIMLILLLFGYIPCFYYYCLSMYLHRVLDFGVFLLPPLTMKYTLSIS